MSLPTSGSITIDDILAELGRPAGSTIDLNDSELLQLAGKNAGESINFPGDFYGKSLNVTDTTTVTLGNNNSDWYFSAYTPVGSDTGFTNNGSRITYFGIAANQPAINISGLYEAADIASITIDQTPLDGAITYTSLVSISNNLGETLIRVDDVPTPSDYSSAANVDLTIQFAKNVLLGNRLLADDTDLPWANGRGYSSGLFGSVDLSHDSFVFNSNTYVLVALQLSPSNDLSLSIDCTGVPHLVQSDIKQLLIRRAAKIVPSVPASDIYTYLTSAASFSTSGNTVTWTWPSLDFFSPGDYVMFSIEGD